MSNSVADKFSIACGQCGQTVAVSRAHLGKKGRCPKCQTVFVIREPEPAQSAMETLAEPLPSHATLQDPLGVGGLSANDSLWNDLKPIGSPSPGLASPDFPPADEPKVKFDDDFKPASLAGDYMKRAREDRGGTIEQEEADPTYRFWTSWGAVIGGICTMAFAFFFMLPLFLYFGSFRGLALTVIVFLSGGAAFVQGLNYVFYYKWKDEGGRG